MKFLIKKPTLILTEILIVSMNEIVKMICNKSGWGGEKVILTLEFHWENHLIEYNQCYRDLERVSLEYDRRRFLRFLLLVFRSFDERAARVSWFVPV